MHRTLSTCAAAIALSVVVVAAPPPISIDVRHGNSGGAPLTVRVRVTVEPDTRNRHMCLSWTQIQGGTQARTSCQEMQGNEEPRTFWQDVKSLSSGKWDLVAFVIRNDDTRAVSNHITLHSFGPNYESDPTE